LRSARHHIGDNPPPAFCCTPCAGDYIDFMALCANALDNGFSFVVRKMILGLRAAEHASQDAETRPTSP
jgi:hypothetical protein